MTGPLAVAVGDIARLRKAHPCGGHDWEVTRTGADIGLRCLTCGRKVLLDRADFERRTQRLTPAGAKDANVD